MLQFGGGVAVFMERVGCSEEGEQPSSGKTQRASMMGNHYFGSVGGGGGRGGGQAGGGGGGRRPQGAIKWRHGQGKSSVLPPPEQDGRCGAYLRTPLWPSRTGPDADMRGVTVRSTGQVPVVRPDGPGPPESADLGKAEGDADCPGGFTPN